MKETITNTTSTGNGYHNLTLEKLSKLMGELSKPPIIYAIDYKVMGSQFLSNNTIVVSKDIAIKWGIWE